MVLVSAWGHVPVGSEGREMLDSTGDRQGGWGYSREAGCRSRVRGIARHRGGGKSQGIVSGKDAK